MFDIRPRAGATTSGGWGLQAFTPDDLTLIHHASLQLLEDVGVKIESAAAVEIYAGAGCRVTPRGGGWIVKIPPHVVEDGLRAAPRQVVLKGRTPAYDYPVLPGRVSFTTFGEVTRIVDPVTRALRRTAARDLADIARLCEGIDSIKIVHRPAAALDKPPGTHPVYNAQALFANTGKHITIGPINALNLRTIAEIAAAHVGGAAAAAERGLFTTIICPSSPLRLEANAAEMVIAAAELPGGGVVAHPVPLAGANNPITLGGMTVNQNVEALMVLILAQLVRRGTRVLFGTVSTIMDMRTMTTPFGAPELAMLSAAAARMARYYDLPSIVPGAHSDSKVLDPQVGYESALGGLLGALAGANFVYGLGTLEDALTFDYAKFMLDVEMSRMVDRIVGGIGLTDEDLALDVTRQIGPGGDGFLGSDHTYAHMRGNFEPALFDRLTRDTWRTREVPDLTERAYAAALRGVREHVPPAVAPEVTREVTEIIAAYLSAAGVNG